MEPFRKALDHALGNGEVGIQLAIYSGDELVVDLAAGVTDRDTGAPATTGTLFNIFSVTKGIAATALHIQADRGLVDYQAPIAEYWPEFAAQGKATARVIDVLQHRLGVYQMPSEMTPEKLADFEWMVREIAGQPPLHEPGTTNAYLSYTFGWIVAEIVRRTDPHKRDFPAFLRDELFTPLGIEDLWLGLPREQHDRVAGLIDFPPRDIPPESPVHLAMPAPVFPRKAVFELPVVRECCFPGGGAIANARSVARVFAMLANGGRLGDVRLLSEETVSGLNHPRPDTDQPDRVLGYPVPMGLGYWLGGATSPSNYATFMGTNPGAFGHTGAGGSIAWADPDAQLAVAVCHNRMFNAPDRAYDGIRAAITETFGVS
jgi:CubicO group peptidase (beta-lactamase class C family)